ncbi:MAG: hypothetical protein ACO3SO_09215 [Luteolibacter sp.]
MPHQTAWRDLTTSSGKPLQLAHRPEMQEGIKIKFQELMLSCNPIMLEMAGALRAYR